jgi:ABC-2 type transport system permease protein
MQGLYLLLLPRALGIRNRFSRSARKGRRRVLFAASVGIGFWVLLFVLSTRVLIYFQSVEVIGDLLSQHLLHMVFLIFFGLLMFSNVITSLSNHYLCPELELCHSLPVPVEEVFLSRSIHTFIDSSWMMIVFGVPVLVSYAYVYRPGPGYYFALLHMSLALAVISSQIGVLFTLLLVRLFPAYRTRDIVMLLSVLVIVALYFLVRFLRPERLVDPDAFFSVMQYMSALKGPDSPLLPPHWVAETLWEHLAGAGAGGKSFQVLLLWSTAASLVVINVWAAEGLYFSAYSKAQEGRRRRAGRKVLELVARTIRRPFGNDLACVMEKDVRVFFRDNTQWSQLLLLGALVVVYLYNFSVLPLEKSPIRLEYIRNELAFVNMALAGFVLSAIAVRFVYPSVSSEGGSFWVIRCSPMSLKRYLWGKYALFILPMTILAETLVIITNHLLGVSGLMMIVSSLTMLIGVSAIVSLAVGFGALYPDFANHNPAQLSTGFGGLMYMISSAFLIALIVLLEAGPAYILLMSEMKQRAVTPLQWLFVVSSFAAVLVIGSVASVKPISMGIKALERME